MINEVLRLLRIAHDLSRKELAQKTGLSQSYIGEIENNVRNPSLETIEKYSEALGIPVSRILFFSEQSTGDKLNYQKTLLQILETIAKI